MQGPYYKYASQLLRLSPLKYLQARIKRLSQLKYLQARIKWLSVAFKKLMTILQIFTNTQRPY